MDKNGIVWPDNETLPCKDCKWGYWLVKYWESSCAKYKQKPDDVYYESQPCPKFEKKEVKK